MPTGESDPKQKSLCPGEAGSRRRDPIFMPSLCVDLNSISKTYAADIKFALSIGQELNMLDVLFLALGLGGFATMAVYARLCDRL